MRLDLRLYWYKGKAQSLAAWAKEYGLRDSVLRHRVTDLDMTLHEAVSIPRRRDRPAQRCRGCRYLKPFDPHYPSDCFCAYILIEHHRRPCSFDECRGWDKDGRPVRK